MRYLRPGGCCIFICVSDATNLRESDSQFNQIWTRARAEVLCPYSILCIIVLHLAQSGNWAIGPGHFMININTINSDPSFPDDPTSPLPSRFTHYLNLLLI